VLPVWNKAGDLLGVFDIDSDQVNAFTKDDENELLALLETIFGSI